MSWKATPASCMAIIDWWRFSLLPSSTSRVTAWASFCLPSTAEIRFSNTLPKPPGWAAVVSPVLGARTMAQLDDNLAALDITLDEDQLARLDAASRIEPGFPHDFLSGPAYGFMFGNLNVRPRA